MTPAEQVAFCKKNFILNIADSFTNGGTTLHVDGSALTNDTLTVNHNNQSEGKGADVDIQITGGALGDNFNMGDTLDAGDTIDGGAGNDTLRVDSDSNTTDADFTNGALGAHTSAHSAAHGARRASADLPGSHMIVCVHEWQI